MSNERYCPTHGPYQARYATCPYCAGTAGQPPAPASLEEQVTRAPGVRAGSPRPGFDEDDLTQMPKRRAAGSRKIEDLDETQMDQPQTGLLGWAIIKEGMRRGAIHRIGHDVTVGRKNADIVLADQKASRLHAKFAIQNDQFVIADMLSENGTFVNDEKITQVTPLRENDEIRIGDTTLVIKTLEP